MIVWIGIISTIFLAIYGIPEILEVIKNKEVHLRTSTITLATLGLIGRTVYIYVTTEDYILLSGMIIAILQMGIFWYYWLWPQPNDGE